MSNTNRLTIAAMTVSCLMANDVPASAEERPGGQDRIAVLIKEDLEYARVTDTAGEPVSLKLDLALPAKGETPCAAVVFIHGGGMRSGSRRDGRSLMVEMANRGFVSASIDYRLMNQGVFPKPFHDCQEAIRYLKSHSEEFGLDPDRMGVWGHSAGAHLAALVTVAANASVTSRSGGEDPDPGVACGIAVSGPHDIGKLMRRMMGIPEEAPWPEGMKSMVGMLADATTMRHVDSEDPPLLVIHGGRDQAIPFEHARFLASAAWDAGHDLELVEVESAGHNDIFQQDTVLDKIAEFFDLHLRL